MNRIVVLSDPSKEFPDNTTKAFKACLPQEVRFEGPWEVGLTSISMPDVGVDLQTLLAKDTTKIISVKYEALHMGSNVRHVHTSYVTRAVLEKKGGRIVNGVGFMKALVREIEHRISYDVQAHRDIVAEVADSHRPTFRWEGEVLVLEKKDINVLGNRGDVNIDNNIVQVRLDEQLAFRMGWLEKAGDGSPQLGPNLVYEIYDKSTGKMTRVGATEVKGRLWMVDSGTLVLSFTFDWRFVNLNDAFQTAVSLNSRTLLVYSDVVSSNVMGDSEHPLIREVIYHRRRGGSLYFEPTHIQWMPMRHTYLDVVEISVAESDGRLATFAKGTRTIVTFQFRRRLYKNEDTS